MANWINRNTLEFLRSVSAQGLPEPESNYVENPDMSGVVGVPRKYLKLVGDVPTEMDTGEKATVDAAIALAVEDSEIDAMDFGTLKRFVLVLLDEINELRTEVGFSTRTIAQLKTAMRNK